MAALSVVVNPVVGIEPPARPLLMKGNEAMAEAAIQAGCDAYFGYPITPQAELLEWMARRMPELGRVFVQAESELAAINMALGAAATGARVLVSSSSPGISLMAEGMSYLAGSELPMVLINVMRGGPGLGSIGPSQSDYFQATKGHGHGDYRVPVLAPSSIVEAVALVADAFELAERYRSPVMILADGVIGQAMEPVIPTYRIPPRNVGGWELSGADGRTPRVLRSLHLQPEELEVHNRRLQAKFSSIAEREVRWATEDLDDAEIAIVAYGTAARVARTAIERAREHGLKVGLFRPITLWPFPSEALSEVAPRLRAIVVLELSAGQLVEDVRLAIEGRTPVFFHGRTGGMVPTPGEVVDVVRRAWALTAPAIQRTAGDARPARGKPDQYSLPELGPWAAAGRAIPEPAAVAEASPETRRVIYQRPKMLADRSTHYCPGCGHGIIHRLVAELLDEMDLGPRTIGVASVGCSVFAYDYLPVDFVESPHGRAPAVATGVRRVRPDAFVFTYQGDGDLAAIGTAEIVHAAARGERFSVIFVNNGIYGMTGGQMAPTTLLGQRTTSSPTGREAASAGYPIPITEMLALVPGVTYAARGSIADPQLIGRTKAMLRRAFEIQLGGGGLSIVEVLSTCPVGWGMTPTQSMEHLARDVVQTYPLGVLVDRLKGAGAHAGEG